VDDRKNLPDHETLIRRVCATAQNQLAEFTEEKLLYRSLPARMSMGPTASHKESMRIISAALASKPRTHLPQHQAK
jgi:hypothetical protein